MPPKAKPPRKVDFNKLKKQWYDKLKKSGFQDIEYDENWIKSCIPRPDALINDSLHRETIQDYYSMAAQLFNEHKFDNKAEKDIWDLHAQGLSIRKIAHQLYKSSRAGTRKQVWEIIKKLETIMKSRYLAK